jgi:hypothetical protein
MENTVQSWHYRSGFLPSPDDFIRSYQHIRRNRQTNLLRCWQIKEPWGGRPWNGAEYVTNDHFPR